MGNRHVLVWLVAFLSLVGCTTSPDGQSSLPGLAEPVGVISYGSESLRPNNGGFGVILLVKGETRNLEACEAFRSSIVFKSVEVSSDDLVYVNEQVLPRRPVYWLDERTSGPDTITDCTVRTRAYDYGLANTYLTRLNLLDAEGPILAVWREDGLAAGVFDLSGKPSDEFRRSLKAFAAYISHAPNAWEVDFYEEATLRDHLRRYLNENFNMVGVLINTALAETN